MIRIRLAHIADLHYCHKFRDVVLQSLAFARESALERGCTHAAWVGDVYDSAVILGDKDLSNDLDAEFMRWADRMHVLGVEGNHETPGALEHFNHFNTAKFVHFARYPQLLVKDGIAFMLVPFPRKGWLAPHVASIEEGQRMEVEALRLVMHGLSAELAEIPGGDSLARVLLYHNDVYGSVMDQGQTLVGTRLKLAAADLEPHADYVALGDIHRTQKLGSSCWYPGSLIHTDYSETGPRVMLIVDVWRGGYEIVDQVILPSIERTNMRVDMRHGAPDITERPAHIQNCDVRVIVKIMREQYETFDEKRVHVLLAETFPGQTYHNLTIEYDKERVTVDSPFSKEIVSAQTLRQKAAVWAKSQGRVLTEPVLKKFDAVELEAAGVEA
ncbi:MAG TPA: hypothetical protein PK916_09110 [Bacteroidota bacterium]|nr:hypothetical protein [Bacteroidota bacterium]